MALSFSTTLAIYLVLQCLLFKIYAMEAEKMFVSFELDGRNLVRLDGNAVFVDENVIQLTNSTYGLGDGSVGRVVYNNTIPLWNAIDKSFANFTTHFQFQINWTHDYGRDNYTDLGGDGLAFFMASPDSGTHLLYGTIGGWLGLFNENNNGNLFNHLVAVEFDTYNSSWDKNDNHIGIDVNNITSEASVHLNQRLNNSKIWNARIDYRGQENMLEVSAGSNGQVAGHLSHKINLTEYLPEQVVVGFSAAAVESSEIHRLISWNFTSVISGSSEIQSSKKREVSWKVGVSVGSAVLVALIFVSFAIFRSKRRNKEKNDAMEEGRQLDVDMDMEIAMEHVPRKFTYEELTSCTTNFSEERRIGQGGFGDVYKGILVRSDEIVAVKRISARSKQGKKEYLAEISIINRLRHRN